MAEGGSDEVIDKLDCGLCFKDFKEPKLLPCLHSFCLDCLDVYVQNNVKNKDFCCPLCEQTIKLPGDGVRNFETNFYIVSDLMSCGEERHCDLCGPEVNAISHCADCEEDYCERCTDTHAKMKVSRAHMLIVLTETQSGRIGNMRKKAFCEKHPSDELKVVCKDCNKMLCLVCKLTEHEKHNSCDIADEVKRAKEEIQVKIQEAYQHISQLQKAVISCSTTKTSISGMKETELKKLESYKIQLKQLIMKRIKDIETQAVQYFDDVCIDMTYTQTSFKKALLSLRNITLQVERMMAQSDSVSMVHCSERLTKQMTECISKTGDYLLLENLPLRTADNCKFSMNETFLNHLLGCSFVNEIQKNISKLGQCRRRHAFSHNACSLSLFQNTCSACFTDSNYIWQTDSPDHRFAQFCKAHTQKIASICRVREKWYYSAVSSLEVKVWNKTTLAVEQVEQFHMYPHGIAYRLKKGGYEELLVCLSPDPDIMPNSVKYGKVQAIPLTPGHISYSFLAETCPAPIRVAVNNFNGLVCLSYARSGHISVHSEDGTIIHSFEKSYLQLTLTSRLFGICFDNENCMIVADRNGGKVLRYNLFGKLIQVLLVGNRPTAVGVDTDDRLWVGYEDINVTVYQMSDTP